MKFVLFTTNLAGGGAEKALAKIGSGLAAQGHEVTFVVCEDAGAYAPPPACRFVALAAQAAHGWLGKRRLAWRLRRLLAAQDYDLLVSTLPFADEIAELSRLPRHVCRIANTLSAEVARLSGAKAARRAARYRRLYGGRRLVAVSSGVAADLVRHFGVAPAAVTTIPNPFDFAAIAAAAQAPCAERPGMPYVLHVGRYAAQKRHDLLLDAFARLPGHYRLVLLAEPAPGLAQLISRHGLDARVIVAGFQANPYPWMAGAELLVLCSDHEGLPNVLIEALACGTRVVSTDCPSGPREILVGPLARGLVPCGDAAALAQAMSAILAAPKPLLTDVAPALAPYDAPRALAGYVALAGEH